MKRKYVLTTLAGSSLGLMAACGSGGHEDSTALAPTGQQTSTVQSLDTAKVLALAQKTSETSSPFMVDDGQLLLTDTSESGEPVSINGM